MTTVRRYVYKSGRQTQFAYTSRGRQKFVSEFLARRWEKDGKAVIVTVEVA